METRLYDTLYRTCVYIGSVHAVGVLLRGIKYGDS